METNFRSTDFPTNAPPSATPTPYPSLLQAWGLIGLLLLAGIPAALPSLLISQLAPDLKAVGDTLAYILAFSLTIWFAFRQRRSSALSFAPVAPAVFPLVALGTVALGLLIEPLTSVLPTPDWLEQLMRDAFTKDAIFSAVVCAPILEEILLRGIITDGFLKRYSPTQAIVWSAVIFGVMHLNPVQTVGATLLGLALGWLYYRTRSLWPCIFLHFVNNSIGSLGLYFDESPDMSVNYTQQWIGDNNLYVALLVVAAVSCYGVYRALDRILPQQPA
ncbi:CPBP family intramembrane glutamic endopeptidase [Spirosoma sordidisoli]|nr:CPBP family intramembrane glutamic endopeptidase [Spirosoma sordidisoli]